MSGLAKGRSWKYRKLWKFYDRLWENVRRCAEQGGRRREKEERRGKKNGRRRGRFRVRRIVVVAILRTFTASQFFRLIIQHARMHLDPLGDCISNGQPQSEILKTEKGQLYIREQNPKARWLRSEKCNTVLESYDFYRCRSDTDRRFLETLRYVNYRQFVIAFREIDRRGGYRKIGCKRGRRVASENKAGVGDKSRLAR